ncbi:MAG: hypothetical protein Q8R55_01430, partial [Candidatus Taylorbacteria bacterium]|nr:hypothetical protein [Candidatus Taylorbacteria bacterium]
GGSAKAFEGGPFRSSGESHVYSYSPPFYSGGPSFTGSYTATCQVSDEAQNKTESTITFSVTP